MVIKGRPPNHFGLHVFHHACVLLMAWGYVEYRQTLCFGGLVANTFVHVWMYYYYFRAALKWETPWKAWVTRLQILQFSVSFLLLCVTLSGRYGGAGNVLGRECDVWERRVQRGALAALRRRAPGTAQEIGLNRITQHCRVVFRASLLIS